MARKAREKSSTGMYNIIAQGADILFRSDEDYEYFIEIMGEYVHELYAFALVDNAVCIALKESSAGVGMDLKPLITKYARYYNRVHDLQGKIFYDRYKSEPVFDENNLNEIKCFLKNVPSEYKDGVENAGTIETLSCIDDYCRMTDEELKSYIESVFKCSIQKMSEEKKKTLAEKIIAGKRISAGRIYNIFELGRKMPEKKIVKIAEKEPEIRKEPEKKKDLSVWLL